MQTPGVGRIKIDAVDKSTTSIDCSVLFLLPHLSSPKQYQTFVQALKQETAWEGGNPVPVSEGVMATSELCSSTTGGSMVFSQYHFLSQETENTMRPWLPLIA